jgi:SAM-dependent methyltransferase
MEWLEPLLERASTILEIGPRSPITTYLVEHRGFLVDNMERDLRYPFEAPDQSYDLVINMEVIEHLKDRDEDNADYWGRTMMTWSGIKSCLGECRRVLVPGGAMLCTTPNPSSTVGIERILAHQPAMVYAPHVRELSVSELKTRLADAGFEVTRLETHWSWHQPHEVKRVLDGLIAMGASTEHRGDNTFCVAIKPAA